MLPPYQVIYSIINSLFWGELNQTINQIVSNSATVLKIWKFTQFALFWDFCQELLGYHTRLLGTYPLKFFLYNAITISCITTHIYMPKMYIYLIAAMSWYTLLIFVYWLFKIKSSLLLEIATCLQLVCLIISLILYKQEFPLQITRTADK